MIRIIVLASINMIIIRKKDYLFALQREWKDTIWNLDKVTKYINVLEYTSFDEYEEDVEECLVRLEEEE